MLNNASELLFLIGTALGFVIRIFYAKRIKLGKIIDSRKMGGDSLLMFLSFIGWMVLPLIYLLTPLLDFADFQLPSGTSLIGVVFLVLALWLLWRAPADLGDNWSTRLHIRESHSLVTYGIYGYIRHPIYAAHWLWGIAQALLLQNWIAGLSALASFAPLYFLRVPNEEQMMLNHFGEEYRNYVQRTGRIFPRIRR